MSTKNYNNMLMEIRNKIENKKLKHKNTILIGDNSSGKSEILKDILKDKTEGYYFIDSVNRTFNYEIVSKIDHVNIKNTYKSVVKSRLEDNIFNLKDTFDMHKTGIGFIEEIYFYFESELKCMLKDFLNIDFNITVDNNLILGKRYKLFLDSGVEKLSSGYQAIIRLFLELLYFQSSLERIDEKAIVIIDEINEFLSTRNEEKILPFLMKKFSNMNFIVTTHSADVVASSIDCNIIVLSGEVYQCLDGNDFTSATDAREIFEGIYNLHDDNEINDVEIILRNLLNSKIAENWTEVEEKRE